MSTNQPKDAPPAYEPPTTSQQVFDRIQAAVATEYDRANEDSTETARMRNFLLYCLSVDYHFASNLSLLAADREHYLEMNNILRDTCPAKDNPRFSLTAHERSSVAPYFKKYFHTPCTSLGIPHDTAVIAVCRFAKFQSCWGRYKGCLHDLLTSSGAHKLAYKLSIDRSILIPRLATSSEMRAGFTAKLEEFAQRYFVSISGCSSAIFARPGGFAEEGTIQCALTARGELLTRVLEADLEVAERSPVSLLARVRAFLPVLAERRLAVFPRGTLMADLVGDPTLPLSRVRGPINVNGYF